MRENRIFIGNPGTGKSTIINCMVGKRVFKSGVSWGQGLTKEYQKYVVGEVTYMDTPGLADRAIIKQAAAAITAALSHPGNYKLFFMVRLQSGRVVSDDLTTIERVLDSIKASGGVSFSILINNLGTRQYSTLVKKGPEFEKVARLINNGKYKTSHIFFIPTIADLEDQDNRIVPLPRELVNFISSHAPAVFIRGGDVSRIDIHGYDKQVAMLQQALEAGQRELEMLFLAVIMMEVEARNRESMERQRRQQRDSDCTIL